MGHMGDVHHLPAEWYEPVRLMDGFHSFDDISDATGQPVADIESMFERMKGEKRIGLLEEWNVCFWCTRCRLYLNRQPICAACGHQTRQVALRPPCDPWILFDEEYAYVAQLLRDRVGLEIDDRRLLLGNNGVRENRFFWEIVYEGRVVLHVSFPEFDPHSWEVEIADACAEVEWSRPADDRNTQIHRMAAANRKTLDALEVDASAFIEEVTGYYPTDPVLYFSGGKESMVMLRLLEKAGQKANVIFVGTGVDFPEDADFLLNELKPALDANPLFHFEMNLAPAQRFLGVFREQGTLDARAAWCRKYIKAPLKSELTSRLYGDSHFVAFEGSRWYENDFRRSHPRVNFAQGYDKQIWVHPLAEWTGLDVWLYIFSEGLRINPMYFRGFQRTTCWLCPIVNPFHLHMSKTQYPELWKTIEGLRLQGFDNADNLNTPF
jgi:3'-phosphoadenosine 5'-phosphosulfate sulfotransferase (PAPS reductase)/FAD synthetase